MADKNPALPAFIEDRLSGGIEWWSHAHCAVLTQRLRQPWARWLGDWASPAAADASAVECTQAHEQAGRQGAAWSPLGTRGHSAAWAAFRERGDDAVSCVRTMLFGTDPVACDAPVDGIAQSVAGQAWAGLAESLRACVGVDHDDTQALPGTIAFKPWLGWVMVSFSDLGAGTLSLLLNGPCVRSMLGPDAASPTTQPPRPGLTSVEVALADHVVSIRAELDGCELDLGSLQGLHVGDIIPLSHSLEAPLAVSTEDGVQVCAGFLGRRATFKAVELLRGRPGHASDWAVVPSSNSES